MTTPDPNASPWEFSRVPGGYASVCARLGIVIEAEEIKRRSDEMTALLTIRSTMMGVRTVDGDIVKMGLLNFLAPRSRGEWTKALRDRSPGEAAALDWDGFLERFINQVVAAERVGEPAIDLDKVELVERDQYLIPDLICADDPTIWFGDGGSMKSYLALAACATIASGSPDFMGVLPTERRNVGYVDWEFNPQAHRRRLGRMSVGRRLPPIKYIRCDRPLTAEVPRLQRLIREHKLGFLVLDSIVVGCDGPAENSDTVGRYLQALRQLGVPTLLIAHVTKSEDGDKKPLGSVMWHNAARLTWFFKKSGDNGEQTVVGLFNRKASEDGYREPKAFSFWFDQNIGQTIISPASMEAIANSPEIAEKMPVRDRIAAVLLDGPMSMVDIAKALDKSVQDVSTTVRRGEEKGVFTRVLGPDRIFRVSLTGPVQ